MKRILSAAALLLTFCLLLTGCVRIVVKVPDAETGEKIEGSVSSAKEAVGSAFGEVKESLNGAAKDVSNALEEVFPSSGDNSEAGGSELSVDGIDIVEIEWVDGSVQVLVSGGETIRFYESADRELKSDETLRWKIEGRELKIQAFSSSLRLIDVPDKALTVELPASLVLKELDVEAVGSEISVSGIRTDKTEIETVSGSAALSGITTSGLELKTVSGKFSSDGLIVKKTVSAESVSGEINLGLSDAVTGFTLKPSSISSMISVPDGTVLENRIYKFGDGSVRIDFESVSGVLRISR